MQDPDLTSFGFTPTESQAYTALLKGGPASGYALAKRISVARANAYQALHGLVAKGAALLVGTDPKIFRAVAPAALLARITREQAARLDRLQDAFAGLGPEGEATIVPFRGTAEFEALALRTAVRAPAVTCFGPADLLGSLAPIWRARGANNRPTTLYVVGDLPAALPLPVAATLPPAHVATRFGADIGGLLTDQAGILARLDLAEPEGLWFSNPLLTGALRAGLMAITS